MTDADAREVLREYTAQGLAKLNPDPEVVKRAAADLVDAILNTYILLRAAQTKGKES